MSIDFDQSRWERLKHDTDLWWAGELARPIISISLKDRKADRPAPVLPAHYFTSFYGLDVPVEDIVDRWDYEISCMSFLGDGFPKWIPNFGPGVVAALLGAKLQNDIDSQTTWFEPNVHKEIDNLELHYNPDNKWLKKIAALYRAAAERWNGLVQLDMTDLGGSLDMLSSFRPAEELLLDLYDHPERVKQVNWTTHNLWWQFFDEFNGAIRQTNQGFSAWAPLFSTKPYYMLQCDFCYMIGPTMFDEFVKPELAATCKRLGNSFYHLDGVGQLAHLDSLLEIDDLKGVQWIPGTGKPGYECWPEIYRKIRKAGKLIQVFGNMQVMDALVEHLGSAEGIWLSAIVSDREEADALLRKYGVISAA